MTRKMGVMALGLSMILLSGCGGGDTSAGDTSTGDTSTGDTSTGDTSTGDTGNNLTGSKWSVTETGVTENCGEDLGSIDYSATVISYSGGDITVSTPAGNQSGTYSGSNISYSGSYSEDGGTTTTSVDLTVNSEYDMMTGASSWIWSNGEGYTCEGTTEIVAVRNSDGGGSPVPNEKKISGYVLDGAISNAKVCIDTNGDRQCNSNEPGSTTSSNGHYSFEYQESIEITEFEVIADIRYENVTDGDYENGEPDYDYVLSSFDNTKEEVNLSPLTTYMGYLKKTTPKTENQILQDVSSKLTQYDEYSYEETSTVEISEYVTSNYIEYEQSSDSDIADINKHLHNINEVLARGMQQSQLQWEDSFYNGDVTLENSDWYENSQMVIENSQHAVFTHFEEIVESVESYSYTEEFSAEIVSSYFRFGSADSADLQSVVNYMEQEEQNEEGSSQPGGTGIIAYTVGANGEVVYTTYYVLGSPMVIWAYFHSDNTCLIFEEVYDINFNGDEFIELYNKGAAQIDDIGLAHYVDSLPAACGGSSSTILNPVENNPNVSRFPPSTNFTLPSSLPPMVASNYEKISEPLPGNNLGTGELSIKTRGSCFRPIK